MTPEQWNRVAHVFESALEREPAVRAVFVAEACGDDAGLRREVESLLAQEGARVVLDQAMPSVAAAVLEPDAVLNADTQLGPYRVEELIGAGGMGQVYRATDTRLNRTVALKVLPQTLNADPQFRARFEREAQAIAKLSHPHICTLHDVGHQDGTDYLVLEYLEGETLAARLERGALPFDQALSCAIQIADALDAAHRHGIVHRDLKPGNVMLTKSGAKLLDFGLARLRGDAASAGQAGSLSMLPTTPPGLTVQGTILGTFQYMAPEQLEGHEADARTDLFAFGAVVYEMFTGKKAFEGKSQASLIGAIMHAEPPPISSLQPLTPPLLERIVTKCLAKDPDDRWQSARDLASELRWLAYADAGVDLKSSSSTSSASSARSRRAVAGWAMAGTLALALAGVSFRHLNELPGNQTVVRSTILPPENTLFDFDVTAGPAAISPDGRMLAFSARSADGKRRLWIRQLDSLAARPLDNTDGATFPFWSPDSRSVAFFRPGVNSHLERVEATGGAPLPIFEVTGFARGGSWGSQGTIIFDSNGSLWSVPAGGGQPVRRTTPDLASGETGHGSPWFLPDGQHYLYWVGGKNEIRLASLDSNESHVVLNATSNAMFASGHLLFLREGTLLAQPFDPVRCVLTGEAVQVAEDVLRLVGEPRGVFSAAENGWLVYQAGNADALNLAWFDRHNTRLSTVADMGDARFVALSPDGHSVAITIYDRQGRPALYRVDLASRQMTRLTANATEGYRAVWSPDGTEILYSRRRNGQVEIWRKSSTGLGEGTLLYAGRIGEVTSWSGRHLLMGAGLAFVLPLPPGVSGSPPTPIPFAKDQTADRSGPQNARFSPDGRWIAYQVGGTGIFVDAFPGGGKRQQIAEGGTQAHWRSDGKELYYVSSSVSGSILTAVEVSDDAGSLRFGARKAMVGPLSLGNSYDVSADGQRILALVPAERRATQPLTLVQNWTAALKAR